MTETSDTPETFPQLVVTNSHLLIGSTSLVRISANKEVMETFAISDGCRPLVLAGSGYISSAVERSDNPVLDSVPASLERLVPSSSDKFTALREPLFLLYIPFCRYFAITSSISSLAGTRLIIFTTYDTQEFGACQMGKFGDIFMGVKKVRWSPPLHSTLEVSATSQLRSELWGGDATPVRSSSSSTFSTSSLPQYKPPAPQELPTPPSRFRLLIRKTRSFKLLDKVTNVAGSRLVFLATLLLLLGWAILGIALGPSDVWQIVMQNASSIQCYVSDTLLMRQQQNDTHTFLVSIAEMRSRTSSCLRMLRSLSTPQLKELTLQQQPSETAFSLREPKKTKTNIFDRACDYVALATGSLSALIIYVVGILVWLCLGPSLMWSNQWQLYINTAVAVELTFTSMFLQNVRRRHADSLSSTLSSIRTLDCDLESRLRELSGDVKPNPTITILPPQTGRMERGIEIYAYVVGSGLGVAITTIVFVTWLSLGHLMHFNSNWWLIIGTYTGLVGFVDGFVLRNVYYRQSLILENHLEELALADREVCDVLDLPFAATSSPASMKATNDSTTTLAPRSPPQKPASSQSQPTTPKLSLSQRISEATIYYCALPSAVIGSVAVLIVLLAVATGLRWSETGQLLCNSPTMIVEGFLLLVLFSAHNLGNERRVGCVKGVEGRRKGVAVVLGLGEGEEERLRGASLSRESSGSAGVEMEKVVVEGKS